MKILFRSLLACLSLSACCFANDEPISIEEFASLIPEWEVAANDPDTIVGDNGRAYGRFQIHKVMVDDYNRIAGKTAKHSDTFDPKFSKELAKVVLAHYAKHIHNQGIKPNTDHLLYIWNGGGGAWKRVENPVDDMKQRNLKVYRSKATVVLRNFRSAKSKQGATMPSEEDNVVEDSQG